MIHLYGVAEDLEQLPEVLGLEDAPLERRHIEGLELVVSRVQLDRPEVSSDAVLRHAAYVLDTRHRVTGPNVESL